MTPAKRKKAEGAKAPSPSFERYTQPPPLAPGEIDGTASGEQLDAYLAELDAIFRAEKNPMMGLYAAQFALGHSRPVPRHVATWLRVAIQLYVGHRRDSVDEGLGLKVSGPDNPRRRAQRSRVLRVALSRMLHLQTLGAKIPEAAALVSRLSPDHAASTLIDRYKRSGYGEMAKEIRKLIRLPTDPEPTLAMYPDSPLEAAQAKAAIRKVYAKRRP